MFKKTNHQNGFTLLEVLIVLGIWSVLILLLAPINLSYLEKQQEEYFFETFAFDVLYAQNVSASTKDYVELVIYEDHYVITKDSNTVLLNRSIPSDWNITIRLFQVISFDDTGRIRMPGSFSIQTKYHDYTIVFPFGKGRYHLAKD